MELEDIRHIENLERAATAGPWFVQHFDDELRMGAVAITTGNRFDPGCNMRSGTWPGDKVVAACLLQSPPYAIIEDDRFDENAELIVAIRNHLPDLLRLARRALEP